MPRNVEIKARVSDPAGLALRAAQFADRGPIEILQDDTYEVEALGHFIELEVVLDERESAAAGVEIAHALLRNLDIDSRQLIEGAYVDLLARAHDHA